MLNPREEAQFAELRDKCKALNLPMPPEIFIGLKVHDKNGILTFDDIQRGHSWTRNFWNTMFGSLTDSTATGGAAFGAGYLTGKTTGGTLRSSGGAIPCRTSYSPDGYGYYNNATDNTYGIVVGTGDTAFSVDHYALAAIVAAGNSSGQLAHQAMTGTTAAYTAGTKTWKATLSRIFNNNSGSSITIKETGLYGNNYLYTGAADSKGMYERSVLSPTVTVANGAQLTVTYEISMDFSAID